MRVCRVVTKIDRLPLPLSLPVSPPQLHAFSAMYCNKALLPKPVLPIKQITLPRFVIGSKHFAASCSRPTIVRLPLK